MLYLMPWNIPQSKHSVEQDRADSLASLRILAHTTNNPDILTRHIPSGPIIYLTANTEDLKHMDTQLSMFESDKNEVTARFTESGQILITFAQRLDTRQIRRYGFSPSAYLPQVKSMAPASDGVPSTHTGILFTLKDKAARDAFQVRDALAAYAREWIAALEPDAKQISLF